MNRHASPISLFGLVLLAMGANVTYAATAGGIPMPEATHGGAIHLIPAEAWGLTVVVQGAVLMLAAVLGRSCPLFFGGALGLLIYGYLAIFAGSAEFGFLVSRGSAAFAAMNIAIMWTAVRDMVASDMFKLGGGNG